MSKTIAALYPTRTRAQKVVVDLRKLGVPDDRINIISHQALQAHVDGTRGDHTTTSPKASEAGEGAMAGTVGGAIGGALAAIGLAAIPGIGWIAAAGPIVAILGSAAAGAGAGAIAGGIAGGLTEQGVSDDDADIYSEALRRGGSLILLTVADRNEAKVVSLLNRHDPIDTDATVARWRSEGWNKYDSKAKPFDNKQANAERARFEQESSREVETLQAVEENVSIGKRDSASGDAVRARSYVVDKPVEKELTLVDESVSVSRNKVNKPVAGRAANNVLDGDDKVVEMKERHEHAVVDKNARVVEEVEVAKTRTERDQTVHANERSRKVDVDNHPSK